jgi:hypothetical protein
MTSQAQAIEEVMEAPADVVKLGREDRPANERPVIFCRGCGGPRRHSFSSARRVTNGPEIVGVATVFTCGTCEEERVYGLYDPKSVQVRV